MDERLWLAERFEADRERLRGVAYRMLGSLAEADDAVQEAWLRLSRCDSSGIDNLSGWLTTVVARVCLDMLRSRRARREEPIEEKRESTPTREKRADPEQEALLADAVGLAMLVVLERLAPAERIAFVLHDMFDLSFEEIAAIVGRSEAAARQLASRARRRVRGTAPVSHAEVRGQRAVVDAFLAASRDGNFNALLEVLAPDVVFRADHAAVAKGGESEVRGAEAVARLFSGRARLARAALVDGTVGILVAPRGRLFLALIPRVEDGRIAGLDAIADPAHLRRLDLAVLDE